MNASITATEANRQFSAILRGVAQGKTFVVTSHGRPIAQIGPPAPEHRDWDGDHRRFIERLRDQPTRYIGTWTRDELYEENEPIPVGGSADLRITAPDEHER